MVWCDFQSPASRLDQVFGGEEQILQTETDVVLHGLIVTLQLPPLLLLLQDDTVDQPQALPQSLMQQPDLLLRARLLSIVGQGDDAPLVRGVVRQEGLPLFLKGQRKKTTTTIRYQGDRYMAFHSMKNQSQRQQ